MANEPYKILESLLADAKFAREVRSYCCHVRRIDESDMSTLKRLITERSQLIHLIDELGIRSPAFDWSFKDWPGPVNALREHLKLKFDDRSQAGWEAQVAERNKKADDNSFEHAERMSVLWAEEAVRRKDSK